MTMPNVLNRSLTTLKRNSPEILTGLGVAGVISTSYLTSVASFKAAKKLDERQASEAWGHVITKERLKRQFKETWKFYIPPVLSGAVTIACIIGGSKGHGRRTAAAVTAYSLTERAFVEYKDHVVEQLGKGKEQKIRDELAQKKVTANPPDSNKELVIVGTGEILCCELWTGRYFKCDMETLRKAENDLNHMVLNGYGGSLSDFYDMLDLDHTTESDYMVWSTDKLMELEFSATLAPDGKPCIAFNYKNLPPHDRS